jgi:hypothetical protein
MIIRFNLWWNLTSMHRTRKGGALEPARAKAKSKTADRSVRPTRVYCLILGFTAEYSKSVRKFTAT